MRIIKFKDISIRNTLIVIQLFTAVVVIVLCITAFVINDVNLFKKNKVKNLTATARVLGNNSIPALLFLDNDAAQELLMNLTVESDIVNACILDKQGKVFAKYIREKGVGFTFHPASTPKLIYHRFEDDFLIMYYKVYRNKEFIGTICLRADMKELDTILKQYFNIVLIVLLTGFFIAFIIAAYMQKMISIPILRLVNTMKGITRQTDYSVRVKPEGRNEIGILSLQFNQMLDQIESRDKALSEAKNVLEEKVEERTRELKARQEQIETIFEYAPDAVIAINQEGRIIEWNPKAEAIFGWLSSEVSGKLLTETIIPSKHKAGHTSGLNRFLAAGQGPLMNKTFEISALRKDHTEFPIELTVSPTIVNGEYIFISFLRDITERKKIEQALRISEDKYRQMIEKAGDVVYTADYKGHFTYLNPRCRELTGFDEKEVIGKHFTEVVYPDWKEEVVQFYKRQFQNRLPETVHSFPIITKSGKPKWIEQTVILLKNGNWITGFQCIVRDITERKQMEQELEFRSKKLSKINSELEDKTMLLEEQNEAIRIKNIELEKAREELRRKMEELALANKFKSEFLANVSHELRTPLNSILILAKLLAENKENRLNEQQLEFSHIIYKSGNDLLQLINDILDLSKIEAGRIDISLSETYVKDIEYTIKSLYTELAKERKIDFTIYVDKKLPSVILTDELRLEQVLKNLLSNAFKFTPAGGKIALYVQLAPDNSPYRKEDLKINQNNLAFIVTDNGIGIPRSKQENIFEAFTQADSSTSRKYGGTGLGLSISRDLIYLLGGEIHLESEEGKGSTFTVYLPLKEIKIIPQDQAITVVEPGETANKHQKSVLVVDDDKIQQKVIKTLIEKQHMHCSVAATGQAAYETILKKQFDCIIIDMYLPDSNGIELIEKIRVTSPVAEVPVVVFTAKDLTPAEIKKLKEMNSSVVIKNADAFDLLLDEIQNVIQQAETRKHKRKSLLSNKTVLLVDDDSRNVYALKNSLEDYAVKVITANNGIECLQMLDKYPETNIVLMDIMMPEMDGLQAIHQIKQQKQFKKIPIIAVTANAMSGDREKYLAAGASDYISKPINTDILLSLIQNWTGA